MQIKIDLVDEESLQVEESPNESLQHVLRRNGFTSIKLGCEEGRCGNCMVLLNDHAVPSCKIPVGLTKVKKIKSDDGKKITSIVTLDYFKKLSGREYECIMDGFDDAGISLCGYCDAGKIFIAYDLIKHNKSLSKEMVLNAVQDLNPCCTDSETLVEGILRAFEIYHGREESKNERR